MPTFIEEALKQGGLFAVAIVCLAGTVATVRIFLWLYKRILDRVDVLVDRSHTKSESDMKIVADLQRTVDKQADAVDAVADQVGALGERFDRIMDMLAEREERLRKGGG